MRCVVKIHLGNEPLLMDSAIAVIPASLITLPSRYSHSTCE